MNLKIRNLNRNFIAFLIFAGLLSSGHFTAHLYADTAIDDYNSTSSSFINVVAPENNAFYLKTNPGNFDFGTIPIDFTTKTVNATATISLFKLLILPVMGKVLSFKLN